MKWPHLHSDPNWQQRGANAYYQCRCGARRVRRTSSRALSPTLPGWPILADHHGRSINDTGWRRA